MLQKKSSRTITKPKTSLDKQNGRLKKRLHEINVHSERELALIFETIEKAKAAFRSQH